MQYSQSFFPLFPPPPWGGCFLLSPLHLKLVTRFDISVRQLHNRHEWPTGLEYHKQSPRLRHESTPSPMSLPRHSALSVSKHYRFGFYLVYSKFNKPKLAISPRTRYVWQTVLPHLIRLGREFDTATQQPIPVIGNFISKMLLYRLFQ